jgi:hypothetical protein
MRLTLYSEFEEDEFFDEDYDEEGKRKRRGGVRGQRSRLIACEITDTDGYTYTVKKKLK